MPTLETLSLRTRDSHFLVNRETGQLRDVSLMTADREATGHGIYIDQRTLETGLAAIAEQGGRLRAAIKHPSMVDYLNGGADRVLDLPGYFSDVHIRGNQLVAGRLDFYDSFKSEHPAEFRHLMEMAEKTPDLFGVSVEIGGYLSFVTEEGEEFSEQPGPDVALRYGGIPAFRITDLPVASFVDQPAANSGLFARLSKLFGGKFEVHSLRNIAESFLEWHEKHHADKEPGDVSEVITYNIADARAARKLTLKKPAEGGDFVSAPNGEMSTLCTLRERITDKARLARAFAILAEFPERPAQEIEAVLDLQDKDTELCALRAAAATDAATIEQLRADLSQAVSKAAVFEGELVVANTATSVWTAKYEALKNSGLEEPVRLGAGAGAIVPDGDSVLAQYEALSGKEKSAFFKQHKDAIWAAKESGGL